MKLYHYAAERFDQLRTRRVRGVDQATIDKEEAKAKRFADPGAYIDHISFFFDPVPSSIMGRIYGKDHGFWYPGHKIFEHVVDTDDLLNDLIYDVVETPLRDSVFDRFVEENDWTSDDPELLAKYMVELNKEKRRKNEIGSGVVNLNIQIRKYVGKTEQAILTASKDPDFKHFKHKYAANVPHLMLYPAKGVVDIRSVNAMVIGSATRTKLK